MYVSTTKRLPVRYNSIKDHLMIRKDSTKEVRMVSIYLNDETDSFPDVCYCEMGDGLYVWYPVLPNERPVVLNAEQVSKRVVAALVPTKVGSE